MKPLKLNLFTLALIGVFYVNAQSISTNSANSLAYASSHTSSNIGMSSGYLNSYDYIYTSESDSILFRNYRDFVVHPEINPLTTTANNQVNAADPSTWPMYEFSADEGTGAIETNDKLEVLQIRLAQLRKQIQELKKSIPTEQK